MIKEDIQNTFYFSAQTTQIRKIFADNPCLSFQSVLPVRLFKRADGETKGTGKDLSNCPLVYSFTKTVINQIFKYNIISNEKVH
jgi:hypothetical protein